jgi:hypothetical protein
MHAARMLMVRSHRAYQSTLGSDYVSIGGTRKNNFYAFTLNGA